MKTIPEQIRDLENTRAAKAARMTDVLQKSIDEGRSTEVAEAEEFDTLEMEIKQIDEDLVRLNKLNVMNAQSASPVAGTSAKAASAARAPAIITRPAEQDEHFKGQNFTRRIITQVAAKFFDMHPVDFAQQRWGKTNPQLVEVIKSSVAGHGSGSGEAGAELVSADNRYNGDFIEYLYSQTVYNQLPLRVVPANIAIKGQDGAATGYFVGESKSIPVSKADFSSVSLAPLKAAGMAVCSKEWFRDSTPAGEMLIRDAVVESLAQVIDTRFLSATIGTSGVSPDGLLYNVTGTTSGGTDTAGLLNDIKELTQRFITAKNSGGLVWVMNPGLANAIGLTRNALGQKEFTEINENGGRLEGKPVYVGHNVNAAHLILMKPSDIYRIDAGGLEVSVSEHATIEMADNPAGASDDPVAQANYPVSMYQSESVAVKAVLPINWQKRRSGAVQFIKDAAYGASIST